MRLPITNKFMRAFNRNDLLDFIGKSKSRERFYDRVIGHWKKYQIHLTNDPEKMLGCGFRLHSSYSPDSPSFKYLPSLVWQDYMGMLYITDGSRYKMEMNGEEFVAPNYLARAFVMINPGTTEMLVKMPTYADPEFYKAFDNVEDKGFGHVGVFNKAPEIHLDTLKLYQWGNHAGFMDQHIAICGSPYPCKESVAIYNSYYGGKR